jgi:hypothetical protein
MVIAIFFRDDNVGVADASFKFIRRAHAEAVDAGPSGQESLLHLVGDMSKTYRQAILGRKHGKFSK